MHFGSWPARRDMMRGEDWRSMATRGHSYCEAAFGTPIHLL
jgi:hypothetical protein